NEVPEKMRFRAFVDNDCILYVNGQEVLQVGGDDGAFYNQLISTEAFVEGVNYIAVVGWDRHSGPGNFFYFDWRLDLEYPLRSMNPAHMIYDAIVHPSMLGEPAGLINEQSFTAAADRLYN